MSAIYIIDDDVQIAEMLCAAMEDIDLVGEHYLNARDFLKVDLNITDIILLDLNMPDVDGIEVIRTLSDKKCESRLILISGHDKGVLHSAEQLAHAHSLNVIDSLTKPIQLANLQKIIKKLVLDVPAEEKKVESFHLMPELDELKIALDQNQLLLHYQPQVDIKTGEIKGVEALVRWQHPERGLIYPNMFISLAEENNLIADLTSQVIAMSMQQSREWKNAGLNTRISVNISAENITGLTLPEQLSQMLIGSNLDPAMLTLEITESALMGELVTSLDILTRLRMKGFGLSIDDFGTGYSSLSQLHRIPFTELKIDQSFIMSMESDDESRAIVKTCIILGHELNMEVVAEGVESQGIMDTLKILGCDIAQGYHIARPMPHDKLLEWVQDLQ